MSHKCTLRLCDTKPTLLPLSPGSSWLEKLLREIKKLSVLNENDLRCQNFLKTGAALRIEKRRHAYSKYWYIIHPFSKFSQYIEVIFFITLIHRWVFLMSSIQRPYWYISSAIIRDVIHVFIMFTFFLTGYVRHATKEIYIDPRVTIKHYVLTYFFIDLFLLVEGNRNTIIVKIITGLGWDISKEVIVAPLVLINLVLTTIRFVSVQSVIINCAIYLGLGSAGSFIVRHICTFIFILHFFAVLLFVIPYNIYVGNQEVPADSWISLRNLTIENYSVTTYAESFLLVISYFFGSYHYTPINQPYEQLLLFLYTFTGRFYVLIVIGIILAKFGFSDTADTEYENILKHFNSFMTAQHVPNDIKDQIIERFEYNYQKKFFNVEQMMAILTDRLKSELFLFGAKRLISSNKFLRSLNASDLCWLFAHMKTSVIGKSEIVVDSNQTLNSIYFVLTGNLAAYYEEIEVFHARDNDVIGLPVLFEEGRSPYFILAVETSEVYYVKKKWFEILLEKHPEAVKYFKTIYKERMEKLYQMQAKSRAGEDGRQLLRKGLVLEQRKRRQTGEFEYEINTR